MVEEAFAMRTGRDHWRRAIKKEMSKMQRMGQGETRRHMKRKDKVARVFRNLLPYGVNIKMDGKFTRKTRFVAMDTRLVT